MKNYYQIRWKISECYDRIDFLQSQNSKLEKNLDELYILKQNYNMVEDRYGEYNYKKNIQAKKIGEIIPDFKFAKRLSDNLIEIINGNESKKAAQSISLTQNKIIKKIMSVQEEISDNQKEINYLRHKISDLEYQLRTINFDI